MKGGNTTLYPGATIYVLHGDMTQFAYSGFTAILLTKSSTIRYSQKTQTPVVPLSTSLQQA